MAGELDKAVLTYARGDAPEVFNLVSKKRVDGGLAVLIDDGCIVRGSRGIPCFLISLWRGDNGAAAQLSRRACIQERRR